MPWPPRLSLALPCLLAAAALHAAAPEFEDCYVGPPNAPATMRARCASLEVAEDPARVDGRRITLRLARIPARAAKALPDPLLFLAGGPGQAATESYAEIAGALREVQADRDVYLLDQRGTGGSAPLTCAMPEPGDPAWAKFERGDLARLASDCAAATSAEVAHYTTRDYLRDLETVRTELGIAQWNLYGGSYGTRVALSYLAAHPEAIRTVVLDGVVPQQAALGQDHGANLDRALAAQFARCVADAACQQAFGDPGATLATLRERYRSNPEQVTVADPQTGEPVTVPLNHDTLAGIVRLYAYQPETTALLPLLLHRAALGNPAPLVAQARMLARVAEQIAYGMQLSVICSEDAPWYHDDPDDQTLIGPALRAILQAQCAVWPVPRAPDEFKQAVASDRPVLLLSGEFDPVTPPAFAAAALATLSHGRHLVAPGMGHIVLVRGCMPKLVAQFVKEGTAAKLDAACLARLGPPPFFLDFTGGAP
jgi:pimeloyl-ACP methyl ester carboxylesterase